MEKIRLADYITSCIEHGDVDVYSYLNDWECKDEFQLCSKGLYTRNTSGSSYYTKGYNSDLISKIPDGSWWMKAPERVGPFWNRKWYIRVRKYSKGNIVLVTGFTQSEIDMLADVYRTYAHVHIELEKKLIQQAKADLDDQTAWYP